MLLWAGVIVEVVVVLTVRLVSSRSSPGSSSNKHISKAKIVDGMKCLILYSSYADPQTLRGQELEAISYKQGTSLRSWALS